MDGWTHGRRQNYIPPSSSGDNRGLFLAFQNLWEVIIFEMLASIGLLEIRFLDCNNFLINFTFDFNRVYCRCHHALLVK